MDKKTWIIIVLVAIVAIGGWLFFKEGGLLSQWSEPEPMEDTGPDANQLKTGTTSQAKAYTQLVNQYKDRRIQFDAGCQAIPSNITYKNGTTVMFDNRSGDARQIKIGSLTYSFAGYGWKILTLRSSTLPKTLMLNCGAGVNVGQILLQK